MRETHTQILQRLEKKFDSFSCNASPDLVREHSDILATIPAMGEKIDRILDNQEEQFKRLTKTEKDVLVMQTQRSTERGVLAFIAGIIGAVAGWFGRHI